MTTYTISQIEQAINYWHAAEPGGEFTLNAQARILACIYGLMIYNGRAHVALADLTVGQVGALTAALGTQRFSTAAAQEWAGLAGKEDG